MTDSVVVRNRLGGFVQVHLAPVRRLQRARRDRSLSGIQLARALGLYVVLVQLVDENDMKTGGREPLLRTREQLGEIAGTSGETIAGHLRRLTEHKVVRVVDRYGAQGRERSEFHLLDRRKAFVQLPAAALDAINATVSPSGRLGHYAFYLALHDLANDSRDGHRQTRARYVDISARCGLSIAALKDHKTGLVRAAVLQVTPGERKRRETGSTLWDLIDVLPRREDHRTGHGSCFVGDRNAGLHGSEIQDWPGQIHGIAPAKNAALLEPESTDQHRESWLEDPRLSGLPSTRASGASIEDVLSETSAAGSASPSQHDGGGTSGIATSPRAQLDEPPSVEKQLCELLSASTVRRIGSSGYLRRPQSWPRDPDRWLRAVRSVLDCYEPDEIRRAIEFLDSEDGFYSRRCLTMADLERDIDGVLVAARTNSPARSGGASQGLRWAEAWPILQRAISDFGADRGQQAYTELGARDPRLAVFAKTVGWSSLCSGDATYSPARWRAVWDRTSDQTEEAA